jgi:hypothetical protein
MPARIACQVTVTIGTMGRDDFDRRRSAIARRLCGMMLAVLTLP